MVQHEGDASDVLEIEGDAEIVPGVEAFLEGEGAGAVRAHQHAAVFGEGLLPGGEHPIPFAQEHRVVHEPFFIGVKPSGIGIGAQEDEASQDGGGAEEAEEEFPVVVGEDAEGEVGDVGGLQGGQGFQEPGVALEAVFLLEGAHAEEGPSQGRGEGLCGRRGDREGEVALGLQFHDLLQALSGKGGLPGQEIVCRAGQGIDVAAAIHLLGHEGLLRSHVEGASHNGVPFLLLLRLSLPGNPFTLPLLQNLVLGGRNAEIAEGDPEIGVVEEFFVGLWGTVVLEGEEEIVRLDIPVGEPLFVGVGQPLGHGVDDGDGVSFGDGAQEMDQVSPVQVPGDVFHEDAGPVAGDDDVVASHQVRVGEGAHDLGFLAQFVQECGVVGQAAVQDLDGDLAAQGVLPCQVDRSHAAGADDGLEGASRHQVRGDVRRQGGERAPAAVHGAQPCAEAFPDFLHLGAGQPHPCLLSGKLGLVHAAVESSRAFQGAFHYGRGSGKSAWSIRSMAWSWCWTTSMRIRLESAAAVTPPNALSGMRPSQARKRGL